VGLDLAQQSLESAVYSFLRKIYIDYHHRLPCSSLVRYHYSAGNVLYIGWVTGIRKDNCQCVPIRDAPGMPIYRYPANKPCSIISAVLCSTWISKKLLRISLSIVVLIVTIVSQFILTILFSNPVLNCILQTMEGISLAFGCSKAIFDMNIHPGFEKQPGNCSRFAGQTNRMSQWISQQID